MMSSPASRAAIRVSTRPTSASDVSEFFQTCLLPATIAVSRLLSGPSGHTPRLLVGLRKRRPCGEGCLRRSGKKLQSDDPEIQAILDAGAGIESPAWIYNEFADVELGDKRLDKRLIKTAGFLGSAPLAPINQACLDWRSVKAAYRLFDNEKAEPAKILAPHVAATVRRMLAVAVEEKKVLLAASDTVFIAYAHPNVSGIGPIGKDSKGGRGLVMHNVLVMTTEGVPQGLVHQNIWARDEVPEESRQEKIERLQQMAIEEKESVKWILGPVNK
jgi:hypothetical protein